MTSFFTQLRPHFFPHGGRANNGWQQSIVSAVDVARCVSKKRRLNQRRGKTVAWGATQTIDSTRMNFKNATINHKMAYSNHTVRMAKPASTPAEPGNASFRKAGPEYARLRAIMEGKGTNVQAVTAATVTAEDPWFLTFKPNSLKANVATLKKELSARDHVEAARKLLLTILFDLTSLTTGGETKDDDEDDDDDNNQNMMDAIMPAPGVAPAPKRVAAKPPAVTPAKKQTMESRFTVSGVVTQAVYSDEQSRERLAVVMTMPANVTHGNQPTVTFVSSSNGASILVQIPRGRLANNMDKLLKGIATMPGFTKMDASFATDKLKLRRENIDETIIDSYYIILDKACDPLKKPDLTVFRSNEDGDTVCVIVLDVPAKNDYGKRSASGEMVMID
jgi:hypothetical protein